MTSHEARTKKIVYTRYTFQCEKCSSILGYDFSGDQPLSASHSCPNCGKQMKLLENRGNKMTTETKTIYEQKGYVDRNDYLQAQADNAGLDIDTVIALSDILGPEEDFDGLVTLLQDYEDGLF